MAEEQTKAERIILLRQAYPDWSVKDIAVAIYGAAPTIANCAYVRVVLNQRKGASSSESDRQYRKTASYQESMRRKHRRCAAKERAYERVIRRTGDKKTAGLVSRKAAAEAKAEGASQVEINRARNNARERVLRATGDRKAAWAAYKAAPYVGPEEAVLLPNPNESCQL